MVPERVSWNGLLPGILDRMHDEIISPKQQVKIGVDSYIVPSSDRKDLIFAVPFILSRDIIEEQVFPFSHQPVLFMQLSRR